MKKESLKTAYFISNGWLLLKSGHPLCRIDKIEYLREEDIPGCPYERHWIYRNIVNDLGQLVKYGNHVFTKFEVMRPDGSLKSRKMVDGKYYSINMAI